MFLGVLGGLGENINYLYSYRAEACFLTEVEGRASKAKSQRVGGPSWKTSGFARLIIDQLCCFPTIPGCCVCENSFREFFEPTGEGSGQLATRRRVMHVMCHPLRSLGWLRRSTIDDRLARAYPSQASPCQAPCGGCDALRSRLLPFSLATQSAVV